ncbi:uncharacterized protein RHIMIDRAFT_313611 [Rhizopus microsporus ATCC 52813]|uniref:Succinate dehydrogenase [ubiquinone] cytochrome b small subunit n=1 Tax=Rhizopus microsporus ATCC 52813 TaxID=1340429 RepID=A0A2G4STK9_RHIZD|nr:uncharacterized protein RHIMIDRAFT_313611 [Rhizopus microsporus ATCC 52813]PHZ12091.1 hypothetical protein RHIMIDRAFT_313611 [Rhizopus microsporus ATCC 52813]
MALRSLPKSLKLASAHSRIYTAPSLFQLKKQYSATTEATTEATTKSTPPETESNQDKTIKEKKEEKEIGYAYGAHHWNMERGAAVALIPLISTQLVYGAHPIVDGLFGVVLPYHVYLGFESCIIDYIPKREYPRLHKAAKWSLGTATGLVMWGCYEFNTNDIGITEFMQRLFAA